MRAPNHDVLKVFALADRTGDLHKAWEKMGSPTTWGNVQRLYKARATAAGEAAAPPPPPASGMRARTPRATQQTPAKPAPPPAPATGTRAQMATARTGPALAKKARRTSHQIETEIANKGTGARPPPTVYRVFIQSVYIAPMLTVP